MTLCEIITDEDAFAALASDWRALQTRAGTTPFSGYDPIRLWWEIVAKPKGMRLHIVVKRDEGRLTAVLPLVVCPKKGFRLLRWAGYDVFFGAVSLAESPEDLDALWQTAQCSPHYDIGDIKYIAPGSREQRLIARFRGARLSEKDLISHARFKGESGEEWFKSLRKRVRSEDRRHRRLLEKCGPISFAVYREEAPLSVSLALIRNKRAWCAQKGILNAAIDSDCFLPALIDKAARQGWLAFLCLTCNGQPIGFCLSFTQGRVMYGYHLAYDSSYASCSPGSLTAIDALRWAADHEFDEFNFMEGRETYKTRYASQQDEVLTYLFCRTWRGYPGVLLLTLSRTAFGLRLRRALVKFLRPPAQVG